MQPFVVLQCAFVLLVMDINRCNGTPMRDERSSSEEAREKRNHESSEYVSDLFDKYGIDDSGSWDLVSQYPDYDHPFIASYSNESPISSRKHPTIIHDVTDVSGNSPSISPSITPNTSSPSPLPSTQSPSPPTLAYSSSPSSPTSQSIPSIGSSPASTSASFDSSTPSSWTVTSQATMQVLANSETSSPKTEPSETSPLTTSPSETSRPSPHAGEHLHWLLKQEQRRHPWQAPTNAPRAIQEALEAYKRSDYTTFCRHAMMEDKVPLRVTDGSFHPKFEIMPGVGVYRFHATPATWEKARVVCEDEGAQIAIVNSLQEAKVLSEIHNRCPFILDTHFNDYQFVGAHDIYSEGDWETTTDNLHSLLCDDKSDFIPLRLVILLYYVHGDKLNETGYLAWGFGQPDNAHFNGENCLAMNRYGFFNDVPCWVKLPFTCEHA